MLPSERVAFALVPSKPNDNWEWFMGHVAFALVPAVARNGILLWDLWPGPAKIPLFPLEFLIRDPLVGAYPAPH